MSLTNHRPLLLKAREMMIKMMDKGLLSVKAHFPTVVPFAE